MPTTSSKRPEEVAALAAAAAEKRASFVSDALASRAETLKFGRGYSAAEVHAYLQARAGGKVAPRPKARS